MSPSKAAFIPHQLVVGDPRHGVVRYAHQLRGAVASSLPGRSAGHDAPVGGDAVHVHFTDRLFGSTPEAAADRFVDLARRRPVSVTLHDLPQQSDGRHRLARETSYARVAAAARAVVCNSRHELTLLRQCVTAAALPPTTVIPLPIVGAGRTGPGHVVGLPVRLEAAVLGFWYPGKGHDDVVAALLEAHGGTRGRPRRRPRLTVLGGASDGHEDELAAFVRDSAERGARVEVTGYLPDEELVRRSRRVAVPVVAHQHVSASGSLNSWIAAGRRPLVRDSRYAREMALLRPGTMTTYPPDGLAAALRAAAEEPAGTWLSEDAVLFPHLPDVAAAYLAWWREVVPW